MDEVLFIVVGVQVSCWALAEALGSTEVTHQLSGEESHCSTIKSFSTRDTAHSRTT